MQKKQGFALYLCANQLKLRALVNGTRKFPQLAARLTVSIVLKVVARARSLSHRYSSIEKFLRLFLEQSILLPQCKPTTGVLTFDS